MKSAKKLYTVTDLGPGDGGKGGVVHKISSMMHAHTVLKVGGAQGSHGVVTSRGERFAFSQFGCGTFEGARTHLTPRFIASPEGLLNEADALYYECGIRDVVDMLTIDENVTCATPYHGIASRIKELSRKGNPRGTIGTGVGEAFRYSERYPDLTIRARDLLGFRLRGLISATRDQIRMDLAEAIRCGFLPDDKARAEEDIRLLDDADFFESVVTRFQEVARRFQIVDHDYLRRKILSRDGVVVVESSHGVLTDCYQGFYPHTSAIRTLPRFTHVMLDEIGYDGEVKNIAVSRAYQIRHGAGPMPTTDPTMSESLLPGSSKGENRYQGKVRTGPLDLVLLRYAISVCGGPKTFNGLAITWFDQPQANGAWQVCGKYRGAEDLKYFTSAGELRVRYGDDAHQLVYQENLGRALQRCVPEISSHRILPSMNQKQFYDLCTDVLRGSLGVDVRMVSFGPTERDKVCS